jgi:hypothetical protein
MNFLIGMAKFYPNQKHVGCADDAFLLQRAHNAVRGGPLSNDNILKIFSGPGPKQGIRQAQNQEKKNSAGEMSQMGFPNGKESNVEYREPDGVS